MFIRPIEFNGMVQRTNDVSTLKQNEDQKPVQDQSNFQQTVHKHVEHTIQEVAEKDNADNGEQKFDAKEKGKNEYTRQEQKRKKKNPADGDKVIRKSGNTGFDITI